MSTTVFVNMSVDTWVKRGRTHPRLPRVVTTGDEAGACVQLQPVVLL